MILLSGRDPRNPGAVIRWGVGTGNGVDFNVQHLAKGSFGDATGLTSVLMVDIDPGDLFIDPEAGNL